MSILLAAAFVLGLMVCAILYLRSQRLQTSLQLGRSGWPFKAAVAVTALLGLGLVTSLVSKTTGGKHSEEPGAVTTAAHKPAPHVKKPAAPKSKPKSKPRVHKAKVVRPKPRPKAKPKVVYRPTTVVRTVTVTHTVTAPEPPATTTTPKLAPDPAPPALRQPKPKPDKPKPKTRPKPKPAVFGYVLVLVSLPTSCSGDVSLRIYHPKGGYTVRSIAACTNVRVGGVRLGDNICQVIRPPLRLAPLNSVCKRVSAFGASMVFAQVLSG